MFLWAIYIFPRSFCLFCCREICRPILGIYCIKRSQIHECGNWDWGRAVSFLRVHKSYFLCSVHIWCNIFGSECPFPVGQADLYTNQLGPIHNFDFTVQDLPKTLGSCFTTMRISQSLLLGEKWMRKLNLMLETMRIHIFKPFKSYASIPLGNHFRGLSL